MLFVESGQETAQPSHVAVSKTGGIHISATGQQQA